MATTTSTANIDLVTKLGADVVIDYRTDDFATVLHDYDVVLNSLDNATLMKSLRVLEPGGKLISISGPPDPGFARELGKPWTLGPVMRVLSSRVRRAARKRHISYSFLFMRASGDQLREITALIDNGIITPVVDRVFPFASTNQALAYLDTGRARGKVVLTMKREQS